MIRATGVWLAALALASAPPALAQASATAPVPATVGTAQQIGRALMTTHLLPFELVSLLLLIGIVSAVVVAKRRL